METFIFRVILSLGLASVAGCASGPATSKSQSATAAPQSTAAAPAVSPRAPKEILQAAASKPSVPLPGEGWCPLFDGKTLAGWRQTEFAGRGEVELESGLIILNQGDPFTGINFTNEVPKMNYEIGLDAMRVMGSDFFCGLTVPVGETFCSLIVGGWGGSLLGISSLDRLDASENETTKFRNFETGKWYRIRLRVTESKIEGWIDDEKMIDVVTKEKQISVRPGDIEMSKPLGISSWQTTSALRGINVRPVEGPDKSPK